jgi:hypothetical protein
MWTPEDRALVGDYGSGQVLSDDQFRFLEPLIPSAKPGGRPRQTDMRRLLDSLFYLVRTGCQWRHLPPPPLFVPWPTPPVSCVDGPLDARTFWCDDAAVGCGHVSGLDVRCA